MAIRARGYFGIALALGMVASLVRAEGEDAKGVRLGPGSRLILTLDTFVIYNDNFYYQENNEESGLSLVVHPGSALLLDRGDLRMQFGASAEAAGHDVDGDRDDYLDTALVGKFDWNPLTAHLLKGNIYRRDDHDPFGTNRTENSSFVNADLDEWEEIGGGLAYRFGAPEAKINLEVGVGTIDREYTTNRAATQFLDYDADIVRGVAFYNLSSKTALLAEVISSDVNYDNVFPGVPSRAGDLMRYRVGARWEATGKTSGDVRIGRLERDFDDSRRPAFEATDWEVGIDWSPRARDRLRFTTGRDPQESYLVVSGVIDNKHVSVTWTHDWTALWKSTAGISQHELSFEGTAREDDFTGISLGVEYNPTPRWALYGELKFNELDSNAPGVPYDSNVLVTGIRLVY